MSIFTDVMVDVEMSEFTDLEDDWRFLNGAVIELDQDVLVDKLWWQRPPGKQSTRVSLDVPVLSEDKRAIEPRNMVCGWKCQRCAAVLFGTCINDLKHSPCCEDYL